MKAKRLLLLAWGFILVAAVCWPFALPGEFLWRDMALLGHPALSPSAFGGGSLPARNAPQDGFLAVVGGAWAARVLIFAAAASSAHIAGFMRFDSDNRQAVLDLLQKHPVVLHGGTVELCELPKS